MTDVVIGAGTNLGARVARLRHAVRALRALAPSLRVRAVSPIYESDALVPDDAPADWRIPYCNLAVRADWNGTALELVGTLKQIEIAAGRQPAARWAPRELDLDLLAFGSERIATDRLVVPHAGLAERPFALLPLADVWPEWTFPSGADSAGERAAARVAAWRGDPDTVPLRTRRTAHSLTEIVGVLNVTPDSFSDGGRFLDPGRAVEHAVAMVAEGAEVVDIGAESTRPGSAPLDHATEWDRLAPVLQRLVGSLGQRVSIDTRHADTARRAVESGACWINDVTGFRDPRMVSVLQGTTADLVVMHSLTIPPSREQTLPLGTDPTLVLRDWARQRLAELEAVGIPRSRVILDPGVGFGKTADQSTAIVRGADLFHGLNARTLIGHSRKSFLATWFAPTHRAARNPADRDLEAALIAAHCALLGVDYVRVHDVDGARRALRAAALVGRLPAPPT